MKSTRLRCSSNKLPAGSHSSGPVRRGKIDTPNDIKKSQAA
jgi:hypothetical protein